MKYVTFTALILVLTVHCLAAEDEITIHQFDAMPLAFTQNEGQWDERVLFRAQAGGATMWFTGEGVCHQFFRIIGKNESAQKDRHSEKLERFRGEPDSIQWLTIKASFVGANQNPRVIGEKKMEYKCNYLLGDDPLAWRTDVSNYQAVYFEEIYPGIDLKYYGNGRQMEYDFVVSPGADYSQIRVRYEGCDSLSINGQGELVVATEWGSVIEKRPVVYQIDQGRRIPFQGAYVVFADHSFGFDLGNDFDPRLPLVIDPVLVYSSYVGGDGEDRGYGIAVDGSGNAYITGYTNSSDFPTTQDTYQSTYAGGAYDVFVTKLNSAGNGLVYSTYLGGNSDDKGYGIAVDGSGNAYVTGNTQSHNFPSENPFQPTHAGGVWDAFVAKLNSEGNGLIYSTYLGGNGGDYGMATAVDEGGNAYVTGTTVSGDFPTQNPYQTNQPGEDVFVTKLNSTGNGLVYSTYLGGDGKEWGYCIAVDGNGNAYVTGHTRSSDFPIQGPYQTDQPGGDSFVTKLNIMGNGLVYSTYLGGNHEDYGHAIAVDGSGNAYVSGHTRSNDFPTKDPYQTDNDGALWDGFVTKLNSAGNGLVYSTYLGGNDHDYGGYGIAVDGNGNAYVTGSTWSSDFPIEDSIQTDQPLLDVTVTKLNSAGNGTVFSTYLV